MNAFARHGGTFITQAELKQSLDPIQRIRKTAGDEMEIGLDLSSKWNLPCSLQIAKSLKPYGIMYLEDPTWPDNIEAYATLARETSIPVCLSERLATRFRFREMFESRAVDVVMYDVTWYRTCVRLPALPDPAHSRCGSTQLRVAGRRLQSASIRRYDCSPFENLERSLLLMKRRGFLGRFMTTGMALSGAAALPPALTSQEAPEASHEPAGKVHTGSLRQPAVEVQSLCYAGLLHVYR